MSQQPPTFKWQYGVTTVPARFGDLLPKTLNSLSHAGFDWPWLFVDGDMCLTPYNHLRVAGVTLRQPRVRTFGNWVLAILELWLRDPQADRYAIFQDDILACKNLREYIDRSDVLAGSLYLNLFSACDNEPTDVDPIGWRPSVWQNGRGALGLVFDSQGVQDLFAAGVLNHARNNRRGWRSVDAAVIDHLKLVGYKEWVHNPSLVQHMGAIGQTKHHGRRAAQSFPGEEFDAISFLINPVIIDSHAEGTIDR